MMGQQSLLTTVVEERIVEGVRVFVIGGCSSTLTGAAAGSIIAANKAGATVLSAAIWCQYGGVAEWFIAPVS